MANTDYSECENVEHLFDEVEQAGIKYDNVFSDLLIPVTDVTTAILERRGILTSRTVEKFHSNKPEDNSALWYSISFAYMPYWIEKLS